VKKNGSIGNISITAIPEEQHSLKQGLKKGEKS